MIFDHERSKNVRGGGAIKAIIKIFWVVREGDGRVADGGLGALWRRRDGLGALRCHSGARASSGVDVLRRVGKI